MEYETEVQELLSLPQLKSRGLQQSIFGPQQEEPLEWPLFVALTNGKVFGCDLVVSAMGVFPNTTCLKSSTGQMEVFIRGIHNVWQVDRIELYFPGR